MNRDTFKQNKNIILSHLKINWKLVLFFTLFWLVISLALLINTLFSHIDETKISVPVIGNYSFNVRTISTHGGNSSHSSDVVSISKMLNWALFSGPAIVFFSIFTVVLLNKILIKEVNNSQITCWITMPLSRKQILSSKILYIILSNFIVFFPSYILILIFAAASSDANQWFGYVVLYGLQFILFITFLTVIYTLVSIILVEKTLVLNILNSLIVFWILVTWIVLLIYEMSPIEYEELKYVQYVSLQSLVVCPLKFSLLDQNVPIITKISDFITLTIKSFKHIEINKVAISICTLAMPIFTTLTILLNNFLFENKDLHI